MKFENDLENVARWVRRHIGSYELQATEQEKQKLNDIAAACIGLHEVAHLRYEDHYDNFVSYLLELQYNYFQKGVQK